MSNNKKISNPHFIAFFDILGYQNILKNNSSIDILKIIDSVINETIEYAIEDSRKIDGEEYYVFSDSIIYSIPVQDESKIIKAFTTIAAKSNMINYMLFSNGMPSRGVIHYGDFIIQKSEKFSIFSGEAIVDSKIIQDKLNLSTVVFTENIINLFKSKSSVEKYGNDKFFSYLVPMSDGVEKEFFVLNLVDFIYFIKERALEIKDEESRRLKIVEFDLFFKDLEQYVYSKFWMHNKHVSTSVDAKIANTIKLMRYGKLMCERVEQADFKESR